MKQGKNDHSDLAFTQYADAILDIMLQEDGVCRYFLFLASVTTYHINLINVRAQG